MSAQRVILCGTNSSESPGSPKFTLSLPEQETLSLPDVCLSTPQIHHLDNQLNFGVIYVPQITWKLQNCAAPPQKLLVTKDRPAQPLLGCAPDRRSAQQHPLLLCTSSSQPASYGLFPHNSPLCGWQLPESSFSPQMCSDHQPRGKHPFPDGWCSQPAWFLLQIPQHCPDQGWRGPTAGMSRSHSH